MLKSILGEKFCLPDEMREEMRRLYGDLYQGESIQTTRQILQDIGVPTKLIAVGDITTFNLLRAGNIPDISVVDEKTQRVAAASDIIKGIRHSRFRTISVSNPAGYVTRELVAALTDALDYEEPVQVMVDGEEDLAALPAIVLAPVSSVVIYGFPKKGAVVVRVTSEIKQQICDMLERMKCDSK